MIPLHHEPHFTFRFGDDRLIPRFRLEGVEAGLRVSVFKIDPDTDERLGLLAKAIVGEGGWADLSEPIVVRAGEAFIAVLSIDPMRLRRGAIMRNAIILGQVSVLMLMVPCGNAPAQESAKRDAKVGPYRIELPAIWSAPKQDPKKAPIVAVRHNKEARQIGEILAAPLAGSVEKETSELIESAKKNPAAFSVEESGAFVTKDGVKGKKIVLAIKARDPNYGSPLTFCSIYLPNDDGSCITVKLRCGSADFAALRSEFDDILAGATKASP
jgi:hypothetical protein